MKTKSQIDNNFGQGKLVTGLNFCLDLVKKLHLHFQIYAKTNNIDVFKINKEHQNGTF
jgi:hypothetical protein